MVVNFSNETPQFYQLLWYGVQSYSRVEKIKIAAAVLVESTFRRDNSLIPLSYHVYSLKVEKQKFSILTVHHCVTHNPAERP